MNAPRKERREGKSRSEEVETRGGVAWNGKRDQNRMRDRKDSGTKSADIAAT